MKLFSKFISIFIISITLTNSSNTSLNLKTTTKVENKQEIKTTKYITPVNSKSEVLNSKISTTDSKETEVEKIKNVSNSSSSVNLKPSSTEPVPQPNSYVAKPTPDKSNKPAQVSPSTSPAPVVSAPKPAPQTVPATGKLILGYGTYYYSGDSTSYNSLIGHSTLINELATHTYIINNTGGIYIQDNGPFPQNQISYANGHGIKTLAVVRNEFNASVATSVLNNSTYRINLINSILNSIRSNSFKGVNVDFEMLKSSDREAYTSFMKELYTTLHPLGYLVSIALPAKTYDSSKAYWSYAYDYEKLGNYSDQVILMTYDEHYPGGAPGPIASISWVQQVVNYAVTVIPRSKLLLGLAAYGYDWPSNGGATVSYSIQTANSIAAKYGAEVQWDSTAQVPYYRYTDYNQVTHSVYFENSTSIGYKLNIVNNSNLLGAAIWRLGLEDELYWTTIKTRLNK